MSRPDWDIYFLGIAEAVAQRGDCTRRRVGAVVVDDCNRIVASGYNGVESGQPGCLTAGACPRGKLSYDEQPMGSPYDNCIATHAEANAVKYAQQWGEWATLGCTVYLTSVPCDDCIRLMRSARVYRVVWPGGAKDL